MAKLQENINFKNITLIFILLFPFLDSFYFYTGNYEILGISIPSFLVLSYFIYFCFEIHKDKKNKAILKKYYIFLAVTFFYLIIHLSINKTMININPDVNDISLYSEIKYIFYLYIPITFLVFWEKFKKNVPNIEKVLIINAAIISFFIIFLNLFKFSLSSYTNQIINYNFIDWFLKDLSHFEMASKGFFANANEIAATIVLLLPFVLYKYLNKEGKFQKVYLLISIGLIFSGTIVGTRIGFYVPLIVIIATIVIYIFCYIIKKIPEINIRKIIILMTIPILALSLKNYLPCFSRFSSEEEADINKVIESELYLDKLKKEKYVPLKDEEYIGLKEMILKDIEKLDEEYYETFEELKNSLLKTDDLIKIRELTSNFIFENYYKFNLSTKLLKVYYYEYDLFFWYKNIFESIENGIDFRNQEILIIERVKEVDGNNSYDLFGIGYNRVQKIHNIERDFLNQYYMFGVFGFLLYFMPYIIIPAYAIWLMLKDIKKHLNFKNLALTMAIVLFILACYFSGNVFRIPTILYLVFMEIILIVNLKKGEI